jgi:hypothetical protein
LSIRHCFVVGRSFRARSVPFVAASLLAAALAQPAQAQDARVYSANSSNGNILLVSFDPPGTTVVNTDANQRTKLSALQIRDDGVDGIHLIACDTQAGELLFYANAVGNALVIADSSDGPALPDGVSIDAAGNLAFVSSGTGGASQKVAQVWVALRDPACDGGGASCRPGGYRAPLGLLDDDVAATTEIGGVPTLIAAETLEETARVPATSGLLTAGDLLVVSSSPAMVLRYRAADLQAFLAELAGNSPGDPPPAELVPDVFIHPPESSVPASRRFPSGAQPSGVAFAPDRSLLIPIVGGSVLRFDPDGNRRSNGAGGFADFANGLGQGKFKIAVGPQGGHQRAFLTNRNGGQVLRFTIGSGTAGQLDGTVTSGIQSPIGITTTTSNNVVTPTGSGVTIAPTNVLESTFEKVLLAGLTNENVRLLPDPREAEFDTPPDQPLHRSLLLSELDPDLPDVEIPPYVRSFRLGDPVNGTPTFILIEAETSAALSGVIVHFGEEETVLGYSADCDDPSWSARPRLFWAPDENDTPIVEGPTFIDITDECGSIRGVSRGDFSFLLPACRDTRDPATITQSKFDGLQDLLSDSPCIDRKVRQKLQGSLDSAVRAFSRGRYVTAISALEDLQAAVVKNPKAFASCDPTLASELRARAESAIFTLGLLL